MRVRSAECRVSSGSVQAGRKPVGHSRAFHATKMGRAALRATARQSTRYPHPQIILLLPPRFLRSREQLGRFNTERVGEPLEQCHGWVERGAILNVRESG